jgi:ribonuclease R
MIFWKGLFVKTRGKLFWNPKGFAFVETGSSGGGIFIPPENLNSAFDGDIVEIDAYRDRRGMRGRVISVLERSDLNISGRFVRSRRTGLIEPLKPFPYSISVLPGHEGGARNGDMVTARIIPPKAAKKVRMVNARVVRVLDVPQHVGDDLRLVAARYALAWRFPDDVEEEARHVSRIDFDFERKRRRDLRDRVLFTIDGINAKDFDDAVGIEKLEDGTFLLTAAIADVAHLVKPGSVLDREAYDRSFSVYFPEIAIPMLPEILSNGVMSLRPGEDRLALAVEIHMGPRGKVISSECFEAVIRSRARLTYEEVNPFLEGRDAGAFEREVAGRLLLLHRLARHLTEKRRKRGSLDFDLAAVDVSTDSSGDVEGINRVRGGPAEKLIEEAMLLTNQTVCSFLEKHHSPVLYRVHEKPGREDILDLAETLAEVGLPASLHARLRRAALSGDGVSEALQAVSDAYRGSPLEAFVHVHILRSLPRAHYSSEDAGHFGLACRSYLHFTSPIRRYPDLVIHRLVKKMLHERAMTKKESARQAKLLRKIGPEVSEKEKNADAAMLDAVKLKTAAFMAEKIGDEFQAVITSIFPYGMFIEILDPPADGLIRNLVNASPRYRKGRKRKAQAHSIGETIAVRLSRVDRTRGLLEFCLP